MSQSTVTSTTAPTTTTTGAAAATTLITAGRRRKRAQLGNTDSRSPSPEHYIDLTVDSPIITRRRKQSSTSKSDTASNNTNNLNNTIVIEDADSSPVISSPSRPVRQKRTNRIAGNSASSVGGSGAGTANATVTASSTGIASVTDVIELKDHDNVKSRVGKHKATEEPATVISCPICFEELLNTSLKAMSTKCGHIFCENCIQSSLSSRKKCPVCMAPVTLKSCIRLHL